MPKGWIATKSQFCVAMLSIEARCLVAEFAVEPGDLDIHQLAPGLRRPACPARTRSPEGRHSRRPPSAASTGGPSPGCASPPRSADPCRSRRAAPRPRRLEPATLRTQRPPGLRRDPTTDTRSTASLCGLPVKRSSRPHSEAESRAMAMGRGGRAHPRSTTRRRLARDHDRAQGPGTLQAVLPVEGHQLGGEALGNGDVQRVGGAQGEVEVGAGTRSLPPRRQQPFPPVPRPAPSRRRRWRTPRAHRRPRVRRCAHAGAAEASSAAAKSLTITAGRCSRRQASALAVRASAVNSATRTLASRETLTARLRRAGG